VAPISQFVTVVEDERTPLATAATAPTLAKVDPLAETVVR
jgi:hypothetical protein